MVLQLDVASMVEDVLQHHGKRLCDIDSRKAQEAPLWRYEAAEWIRKMVGVVLGRDLPAEPSEEAFRNGLRSGIMLCNVLNKVQPGAVPKVVDTPTKSVIIPDGAALNENQYFENVRNFLVAIEEMGIPTFEVSDLEQGGKSFRVVNSILALKSYYKWKQSGGNGVWKFGETSSKAAYGGKQSFLRKSTADLFLHFLSRNASAGEKSLDSTLSDENSCCDDLNEVGISPSLRRLVRELLSDKSGEDITLIVESMLSNVMEEFECRLESHNKQIETTLQDKSVSDSCMTEDTEIRPTSPDKDDSNSCTTGEAEVMTILQDEIVPVPVPVPDSNTTENTETPNVMEDIGEPEKDFFARSSKYKKSIDRQQRSVKELKSTLHSAKENVQMLQQKYREDVNNLGKHISRLAIEAAGYHKVVEENRKLYNQVQDLKGNIRVYCRVRPFLPGQLKGASVVAEDIADGSLAILTPSKHVKGKKTFTFNKAFGPNSTQEEVFADTQPLIRSVLDGYNVCIFAYGQTGSGKTFTMTGPKELTKESLGVNYRALGDLFQISEQRKDTTDYELSVQMMEIYNEQVRDLLVTDGGQKRLEIRNNSSDGINVPNANLIRVTSTSDVINLMNLGHKNRAVGSTSMNDRSSRSHSCLTVHVRGRDMTSGSVIRGCMHLVDLAGSERCDKTDAVGERLKEATYINKSLSALGDVIAALAQKNGHVPYRNSKLTQLLQDSLGGQAKTLMFVHISPEADALGETLSTLKFAERVSTIELGAAKTNKENNNNNNNTNAAEVKELKEQIASLKAALARKDGLDFVSCASSTSISSWNSKAELQSNGSSSRRHSLDSQDFLINSPAWSVEEEKRLSTGDGKKPSEIFYQKSSSKAQQGLNKQRSPAPSRRHSLDNSIPKTTATQYQTTTTDDSDHELDAATSDSSEADYRWQLIHKSKITPVSKLKKPSPKITTKTQEMRSQIPQPGGRVSNGVNSSLNKNGRQPASSIAGRRKPASGGK
ncbi:hypothetical protein ACS0TY_002239 [Phlomoides rotata]